MVVYAVVLLNAYTYESNHTEPLVPQKVCSNSNQPPTKIIVLLFDEWSYSLTFENGAVSDRFPNLKHFAEQSISFDRAYASGNWTFCSIPNILSGVPGESKVVGHDHVLSDQGHDVLVKDTNHIFRRMKKLGFHTSLCGSYMPFPELFADSVDRCESRSIYKICGPGVIGCAESFLLDNISMRLGRFCPVVRRPYQLAKNRFFVRLHDWAESFATSEINNNGPSFSFVHIELPHMPFIYGRSGVARELWMSDDSTSLKQYLANMDHADVVMGRLIDKVENSEYAENTLLVLMADHNFRYFHPSDKAVSRRQELCRIPLLIHLPGQKSGLNVDTLFPAYSLPDLLTAYAAGPMSVTEIVDWCSTNLPDSVIAYSLDKRIEIK
jgi:hypothetical protein